MQRHTFQAFKDGFYPIVVGGDNSQALGAYRAMKRFRPAAKVVVLDSNIDILHTDEGRGHCRNQFSALEHLIGHDSNGWAGGHFKSLDLT